MVDQATPLDQTFLLILKTRSAEKLPRLHPPTGTIIFTIPSHPNVDSSS